jgi:hypothetical protein
MGVKTDGSYGYGYSWGPMMNLPVQHPNGNVAQSWRDVDDEDDSTGSAFWTVVGFVVAAGIFAVGAYLIWTNLNTSSPDVAGSVRPGSSWNLRDGPSTESPVVGRLNAGEHVVINCLTGDWAMLHEPRRGVYVSAKALILPSAPPQC